MSSNYEKIKKMGQGALTSLNLSIIKNILIPIPSLKTQEKIVNYLDKFTNYKENIKQELQKEVNLRNKQYEFYRDKLLSEEYLNKAIINYYKSDNTRYLSYEKITDICLRQRGIKITAKEMNELNNNFSSVKVFAGGNTSAMLNKDEVGEENVINKPSVIVKSRGNIDFEYYDKEFTHKNEMWSYSSLDESKLNIKYLYYILKNNLKYFRDNAISGKLPQIATGVTDNYKIPLPNIYIQDQVVEILDKFQELTQNVSGLLPDEIEKRQKQYEHYREKLLTFDTERTRGGYQVLSSDYIRLLTQAGKLVGAKVFELRYKSLGKIGTFENGKGMPKSIFNEKGSVGAIHYGHIYTRYNLCVRNPIVKVTVQNAEKLKKVYTGDLVIAKTSENIEDVMKTVAYLGNESVVTGGHAAIFRHNENPKYLSHVFNGANYFIRQKNMLARGVKVIELSTKDMEKIKILIPPLPIQEYIVSILDKFEALSQSTTEGLRREIELREKQYEYYREKLLTFEK
nr:restriction endonuclease subunit S [Fenollaria timonensis]